MLHLVAAGEHGGLHGVGSVSVNQYAQTLLVSFVARGVELLLRHRGTAAISDAFGGKQLDDICAARLESRTGCETRRESCVR